MTAHRLIDATTHLDRAPRWTGDSPEGESWEPCLCCDRPIRTDRRHRKVALADGGASFLAFDAITPETADDPAFVGLFVIGPHCARRLPARFVRLTG
ncbi:MAG: hypothetical protein ACPHP1_04995 [Miltoncostaeaceae bacterium]